MAFVRNCGNNDIEGVAKLEVYKPVTTRARLSVAIPTYFIAFSKRCGLI